jgi:predicted RNase H-like HicB family nuclease
VARGHPAQEKTTKGCVTFTFDIGMLIALERRKREGGYVVAIPAFPGCYSQGETAEEALSNAREAILLTIEDMRARGDAIPDPTGTASARRSCVGAD